MTTYANGKLPSSALKKISTPGHLRSDAAASFERLRAAAKRAGFNMGTDDTLETYRTIADQERLLRQNYDHTPRRGLTYNNGGVKSYKGQLWYKKPGYAVASTPGESNHGNGLAVDFQGLGGFGGRGYAWMRAHAGSYGWDNNQGRSLGESWHFVYNPANDHHKPAAKRKPHRIHTIRVGSKDWAVTLWQRFLNEAGVKVDVDGEFGPGTAHATKLWQKRAKLAQTGVVDHKTWFRAAQGVKPGRHGYRVQIAQRLLGLSGKAVDGKAGPTYTSRAKEMQRWLGVSADAALGSKTISALLRKG